MSGVITKVPTTFTYEPFANGWFRWSEINKCFWPGKGKRATSVNPALAPVRYLGGVYFIAWSSTAPASVRPTAKEIRYVGQTGEFQRRMGQFGTSAGFYGNRENGHSAGWRWPAGQFSDAWICFYPIGNDLLTHLAAGLRCWMEAVALEEFRIEHGELPEINAAITPVEAFSTDVIVN